MKMDQSMNWMHMASFNHYSKERMDALAAAGRDWSVLDVTPMTTLRPDGHKKQNIDCLYYLYPGPHPRRFAFIFRSSASINRIGKGLAGTFDLGQLAQLFIERFMEVQKNKTPAQKNFNIFTKATGLNQAEQKHNNQLVEEASQGSHCSPAPCSPAPISRNARRARALETIREGARMRRHQLR